MANGTRAGDSGENPGMTGCGSVARPVRSLTANAAWNIGYTAASALITFFVTPFLIRRIGAEAYGTYILILSITGVLGFMGYGLNDAVLRHIAHYDGRGERSSLQQILRSASALYGAIGLAGGAVVFLAAPLITGLLKLGSLGPDSVYLVRVAAFTFALNFAGGGYAAVPPALQRYDLRAVVNLGQLILQMAGSVALLAAGFGLHQLVLWTAAIAVLVQAANVLLAHRLLPDLSLLPRVSCAAVKEIFGFSAFSMLTYACGTAWLYADRFVLSAVAGAATVAYLTVPQTLAFRALDFVSGAGAALFPRFAAMRDDGERAQLFLDATWVLTACAVVIFVPCALVLPGFLRLWVGPEFAAKSALIGRLVLLSCMVRGAAIVYQGLCNGLGRPRILTGVTILSAASMLFANFILIPKFGLQGAGYSYCVSGLVAVGAVLFVWRKVLMAAAWGPLLSAFVAPVLAGFVAYTVFALFVAPGGRWASVVGRAAVCAVATAVLLAAVEAAFSGRRRLDLFAQRSGSLLARPFAFVTALLNRA
jgi:O-antigen/teichoic acid export membrane protein